tara:strand:+ start:7243 stop:7692 length:450 start_codon:yes stop_codon:yes gene_type:complete
MSKRALESPPHCERPDDESDVEVYYDPKRYCRAILPRYDPSSVPEDRGDTLVKVTLRGEYQNEPCSNSKTVEEEDDDDEQTTCPMCDGDNIIAEVDVGVGIDRHYCEWCWGGTVTKGEACELRSRDWDAYWEEYYEALERRDREREARE